MDEQTISVSQGATKTLAVERDDDQAVSVRLIVKADPQDVIPLINPEPSATYIDGVAYIVIGGADTIGISPGDYLYQFVNSYPDDAEVPFPGPDEDCDCEEICDLPTFRVCESLMTGAVS